MIVQNCLRRWSLGTASSSTSIRKRGCGWSRCSTNSTSRCNIIIRRSLSSSSSSSDGGGGGGASGHDDKPRTGAGYGNVRDRVFPAASSHDVLYRHSSQPHTCSIIGAPMTYGQPFVGTDSGPQILRQAGLRSMLTALGWRVEDLPDLDFDAISQNDAGADHNTTTTNTTTNTNINAKNSLLVGRGAARLSDLVETKLRAGRFPLILGGDHSIGIGSLAGILRTRPETGVIWVDAHADLNTPAISESGNMHGMPVGLLMQESLLRQQERTAKAANENGSDSHNASPTATTTAPLMIPGLEWLQQSDRTVWLQPDSIVYVGLRDVDPAERQLIHSLGIQAYTMHDIDRYGIGQVMERALQHLLQHHPHRPLHCSFDIDAVDPVLAPATGTAVRGGLTFREAHFVAEAVAQSGNLASAEIVELNPTLSNDAGAQETVELGLQIITSLMGKSII